MTFMWKKFYLCPGSWIHDNLMGQYLWKLIMRQSDFFFLLKEHHYIFTYSHTWIICIWTLKRYYEWKQLGVGSKFINPKQVCHYFSIEIWNLPQVFKVLTGKKWRLMSLICVQWKFGEFSWSLLAEFVELLKKLAF